MPVEVDAHTQRAVQAILNAASDQVGRVLLFGSRARGEARPDSDHDLLVLTSNADQVEP